LGADLRQTGDFLTISQIPTGTPAYESGLNANDQILAMDNFKIANQNDLNARLANKKQGIK
jgi:predicted metalloprotease with PDZ domain